MHLTEMPDESRDGYGPESYMHIKDCSAPVLPSSNDFKYHPRPGEIVESTENGRIVPRTLALALPVTRSEPSTPIYSTVSGSGEAPSDWFTPITSRERVAVMTFEHIPLFLKDNYQTTLATSTVDCFSPRLLPLLDRMKFHFSRAMALARYEADFGVFGCHQNAVTRNGMETPLLPTDVMSSMEVEIFLAGVEEVHLSDVHDKVTYRRYWRFLTCPAGADDKLGGVISATSTMKHHQKRGVKPRMDERWDRTPKALFAEFAVGGDGRSITGRFLEKD